VSFELYSRKEDVLFSPDFKTKTPYMIKTVEFYGGSCVVVEVSLTAFISGDIKSPGQISPTIEGTPSNVAD